MNTVIIVLAILFVFLYIIPRIIRSGKLLKYEDLSELVKSKKKFLLLDVRTRSEFHMGHIPKSKNISHDKLPLSMPKIQKEMLVVVYCRSGQRANTGLKALERAGYTNVQSFGGISRWKGSLKR